MRSKTVMVVCCALLLPILALAPEASAKAIRFGILPVIDTLPLQVAAKEGLFAKHGVEVELVPFSSAMERDVAMQTGNLDGYFGDMVATLLLLKGGVDMRVVTVAYASEPGQRMFGLVTAPGAAATLDDLPKHSIGISESTVIEYLLDRMLGAHQPPLAAPNRVEVKKIPVRLQMLLAGQVDAAVLPEPLLSLAEAKGGAVLLTDEKLALPLTVNCLRRDLAEDTAILAGFLDAYAEAVSSLNAQPEKYRALQSETCRIPQDVAATFPVYRYPSPRLPSRAELDDVQEWMRAKGLLEQTFRVQDIIAGR